MHSADGRGEFIAKDRGLAMCDAQFPETRGNACASSLQAETTFPVAPTACLKITPGEESFAPEGADDATVSKINRGPTDGPTSPCSERATKSFAMDTKWHWQTRDPCRAPSFR